nr:hypothetical protein [Tanacetum cinerariifolium]
ELAIHGPALGVTQSLPVVEGKGKGISTDKQAAQPLLELQQPKKKSTTDQYIFQRRTQLTKKASTGPSTQPQDDTSANVVRDTPSPENAKTGADTKKSSSEGDTEILNVEERGENVSNTVALEERTVELDEGQAGSDSGNTLESRPPPDEDQAGLNPRQSHVARAVPNPEPMHEDFVATFYPQVHESLKHRTEEHVHIENLLSSSETFLSTKNLDDAFTFGKPVHDQTTQALSSKMFTLENQDLYLKIDNYINETVKEAIQNALQASVRERFRELSEFKMKEILHDRMFESGSYRLQSEHEALYEALEASMDRENMEEFVEATNKSCKRRHDDQDPPPKDSDQNKKKRHDSNASASKQPQAQTVAHLPKIKTRPDWLKPVPEEERQKTPELDWVVPPNDLPKTEKNWANAISNAYKDPEENKLIQKTKDMGSFIKWYCKQIGKSKLSKADFEDFGLEELVPSLWIKSEREYDTSVAYVRSHMRILSVVSLKTFTRHGYTYLKEIVLRIADYKEYKILEADFKNLHPNDFKDLYLLHLQGNLNHLSGADKVHIFNLVNLWVRNIVIKHRVEDLQLRFKSYQMKLNLTQPIWDAVDFLFKEDYTIVHKPRAIIYKDMNNQKKMMRDSEVQNPDIELRVWSEDDKRRSKEFIKVIERRLKIRRIFKSLESFVSGRLRDVDYRLIKRTE